MERRKPNRLHGFDYSLDRLYFVTTNVRHRQCHFGHVENGIMHLNVYGQIAHERWHWLAQQYPYVSVPVFVVMPDHVHAIIKINRGSVGAGRDRLQNHDLKIKPLSELMGAYKTTTCKLIRRSGLPEFSWQRSFHDHIIRNMVAYALITDYIENNPAEWETDK